ncbi:hypothetical protein KXW98_000704, partial [Aspergillus fumigatus]
GFRSSELAFEFITNICVFFCEARERERELAKEIQEGDIDDEDAGGDFDAI